MSGLARILLAAVLGLSLAGCADSDLGIDQHGKVVSADSLKGQWLVVNYWAEWCAPCRKEIPELNALEQQLSGEGVRILGVNFDALQGDSLQQAADKMGIAFTVLASDPAPRYDLPPSKVLPVTYIIDDQGQVREQLLGEQTAKALTARLRALRAH